MLIDIQTASPPFIVLQSKATEELKKRMAVRPAVARLIDAASANSGIGKRHIVISDGDDASTNKFYSKDGEYRSPATNIRMKEYECWSKILTEDAVSKLLKETNINPQEIDSLITISCTGFYAPGIDYNLINTVGLSPCIKRTNIGFMGCAASVIGMARVLEALNSGTKNVLMVSVEICSLHLQTEPSRDNILANLIFSDGAAAALFSNEANKQIKLKLVNTASYLFSGSAEFMGWKIGNNGFEMLLSSELPKIIFDQAVPQLLEMLDSFGVAKDEIKHWALHPGGRAILDSLQKGLSLTNDQMKPSRDVLYNFGNMSSASILFVLKEVINNNRIAKGDYCCVVAFGPGLTMEVALLKGE